jgi:nitrite reductase/ring-hydroxylating ferredoxin subunit
MENWIDIGSVDELSAASLKRVTVLNREFAVSYKDGTFGVLSNTCNHAGGPLGKGRLDGEYIVCPWHNWKFHRCTGTGTLNGVCPNPHPSTFQYAILSRYDALP